MQSELVTVVGGASGLGESIARRFAADGRAIAMIDIDEAAAVAVCAQIQNDFGVNALAVICDIALSDDVDNAAERILKDMGPTSVLINSAALIDRQPLLQQNNAEWTRLVDVNLNGLFWCCKAFAAQMVDLGYGAIINLASIAGPKGFPHPGIGAYGATKAAVITLTQQMAVEWAPYRIRANVVSPGLIPAKTGMGADIYRNDDFARARAELVPLGKLGTGEDVAEAVFFLASDGASYVTGCDFVVDGGLSLTLTQRWSEFTPRHKPYGSDD